MILKFIKRVQFILGLFPAIWVLLYIGFVTSVNYINSIQDFVSYPAFYGIFIAYVSIWLWIIVTLFISLFLKRVYFEKTNLIIYVIGSLILLYIVSYDPGNYFEILMD